MTVASGCNQQSGSSGTSLGTVSGTPAATTTTSTPSQCLVFENNNSDFNNCLACMNSMCTCTSSPCSASDLAGCSVSITLIAQCVHNNTSVGAGQCSGLTCGSGQVANFTTCSCQDASPPSSIGAAPGQGDQTVPYLEPGFFVESRYCPMPDVTTTDSGTGAPNSLNCISQTAAILPSFNTSSSPATPPRYSTSPSVNVFQDVGYLRWDLALDASQYSPTMTLINNAPFYGSFSTIPATMSLYYQLKPNTVLSSTSIPWTDCVEHFSGWDSGGSGFISTNNFCQPRAGGAAGAPDVSTAIGTTVSAFSGTASVINLSLNGSSSNDNLTDLSTSGNPALQTGVGLAQLDVSSAGWANTSATGLISNIGYYKYSWGPVRVKHLASDPVDLASGTVTGTVAINMNMGFTPGSMIESTAMSPDALTNTITTRDCSTSMTPHPCVVTSVYRTSGGGVLSQSFSPRYSGTNYSSAVSALPSGITAASTPKVIEDIAQDFSTSTIPARLRAFVRATDGNIYMSHYNSGQWQPWMSLGRPWTCDPTKSSCTPMITPGSIPPIYQAFDNGTGVNSVSASTINANDGISIASEPMIAYDVNTGVSPNSAVLAVFVRVSQLSSSTGVPGPFHNAIFYTVSTASTLVSSGQPYGFDSASNWTQWMPVLLSAAPASTANILHLQGNPAVVANNGTRGVATPGLYVFGTDATDGAGTVNLHPPIARAATIVAGGNIGGAGPTWYNYGTTLRGAYLKLSNIPSPINWTYSHTAYAWAAKALDNSAWSPNAIVSDWTFAYVGNTPLNGASEIRLVATTLGGAVACPNYAGQNKYTAPCTNYVNREVVASEFDLSFVSGNCSVAYTNLKFYGTVWPVNLQDSLNARLSDPLGSNKFLIMGRGVCSEDTTNTSTTYCDPVNPSAAYGVVISTAGCPLTSGSMYYYGTGVSGIRNPDTSRHMVQAFYPTSDIVPMHSHALDVSSNDVPAFLISRDSNGIINNGVWGSSSGGSGTPYFQFFPTGGFAN